MARVFENLYGSRSAIRRNGAMVVIASLVLYALAAVMGFKFGWGGVWPLFLIAAIADVVCVGAWLAFKRRI